MPTHSPTSAFLQNIYPVVSTAHCMGWNHSCLWQQAGSIWILLLPFGFLLASGLLNCINGQGKPVWHGQPFTAFSVLKICVDREVFSCSKNFLMCKARLQELHRFRKRLYRMSPSLALCSPVEPKAFFPKRLKSRGISKHKTARHGSPMEKQRHHLQPKTLREDIISVSLLPEPYKPKPLSPNQSERARPPSSRRPACVKHSANLGLQL